MKSETWLIIQIGVAIFILTLLSFWFMPVHLAGVSLGFALLGDAFKVLLGYKFGKSMPQQSTDAKPGQTSEAQTKITTVPDPPAEAQAAAPVVEVKPIEKEK